MLPRELLKKIRKIEIYTSRLVNNQLAGQYHSVFKGRGMAFSEVRQYMPGDDVRTIDWNVSARMNVPYVKLFTEERDRTVKLLVDMSASGLFGSHIQAKREVAAEIAALVAFSAIKNNDRVGLIIFTDEVELYVPPKKGKKHVLRVVREILTFQPRSPRTNLAAGLEYLGKVARRKSVSFLVSDFLAQGWERPLMHGQPPARHGPGGHHRSDGGGAAAGGPGDLRGRRDRRDRRVRHQRARGARCSRSSWPGSGPCASRRSGGSRWTSSTCAPTGPTSTRWCSSSAPGPGGRRWCDAGASGRTGGAGAPVGGSRVGTSRGPG